MASKSQTLDAQWLLPATNPMKAGEPMKSSGSGSPVPLEPVSFSVSLVPRNASDALVKPLKVKE